MSNVKITIETEQETRVLEGDTVGLFVITYPEGEEKRTNISTGCVGNFHFTNAAPINEAAVTLLEVAREASKMPELESFKEFLRDVVGIDLDNMDVEVQDLLQKEVDAGGDTNDRDKSEPISKSKVVRPIRQ